MRTTMTIYRSLATFIDDADAAYASSLSSSSPSSPSTPSTPSKSKSNSKPQARVEDPSIDAHFRSGVYLGIGMSNIILSLMPGKLATLVELFGYKGDRMFGLKMLMRAGGWGEGERMVEACKCFSSFRSILLRIRFLMVDVAEEGVRRSICDMTLLIFHLVLSSFTFEGVDISVAQKVLDFNLDRYGPKGMLYLFNPPIPFPHFTPEHLN